MAAIGPLLDLMQESIQLSNTSASLLTTLPITMIGLGALLGNPLRRAIGERAGVTIGLVTIIVAAALRLLWPTAPSLLISSIIAGGGIALIQVLTPGYIKREFYGNSAKIMGLYTTGIMAGAATGAATAPALARAIGWPAALALWGIPGAMAIGVWLAATRASSSTPARVLVAKSDTSARRRHFLRNPRAWALLAFFGIGTGAFTIVLAWLPPYYTALGWSRDDAGFLLGGLTMMEVLAGTLVSAFIHRFPDRRIPLLASLTALAVGIIMLIVAPQSNALLIACTIGLGTGSLFPLSLILTMDHVDDPTIAGELGDFVQGGGYIIAGLTPLMAGLLRDRFDDLTTAWMLMLAGTVVLIAMVLRFGPSTYDRLGVSPQVAQAPPAA